MLPLPRSHKVATWLSQKTHIWRVEVQIWRIFKDYNTTLSWQASEVSLKHSGWSRSKVCCWRFASCCTSFPVSCLICIFALWLAGWTVTIREERKSNCFLCVQTKSRSPKPENRTVGLVSSSTVQMLSNHRQRADTTYQGSIGGSTKSFRSLTCQAVIEQGDKQ